MSKTETLTPIVVQLILTLEPRLRGQKDLKNKLGLATSEVEIYDIDD